MLAPTSAARRDEEPQYRQVPSDAGTGAGEPALLQRGRLGANSPSTLAEEDEDEEAGELRRADTNSIVQDFHGAGVGVIIGGLALAAVHSGMAAVLVWYSTQVPKTCREGLGTTFRLMGSLDGVLSVLIVCFVLAAKGLVDAMSHGVLAEKYESEGRTEEAEQQKEEAAKKMAGAFLQGCFPTMGLMLVQACLLATWSYGIWHALHANGATCGSALTVFWTMLAANVCSGLLTMCLDTRAVSRPGALAGTTLLGFEIPAAVDSDPGETLADPPQAGPPTVIQV